MRKFVLLAAVAAAIALPSAAFAQAKVTMRISHQLPPSHHIAQLTDAFAADVKKRTNGEVDVQIFGSSKAFKPTENYPAVAKGDIEGALAVNFQWGATIPEMSVTAIPYFYTDLDKIKKFPGSEANKLLDAKLEAKGVHNLAWFYTTRISIITSNKKPIVALDDFKGIKIRGLNKMVDTAFTNVGASPSALPGDEVYNGLQTGVIDAGLTDISAAYSRKYYEVQKYGTVTPFFTVYFHLYVNPKWWNDLPQKYKDAISAAAKKAEADSIALTEKTAADAVDQLKAKGMVLHIQTPAETKQWAAKMQQPVLDAFKVSAPDAAKILDAINKL
ncbi:MAG: TRAP transporter substrate-binding protein DctP [Rhodospirillales bacterium]